MDITSIWQSFRKSSDNPVKFIDALTEVFTSFRPFLSKAVEGLKEATDQLKKIRTANTALKFKEDKLFAKLNRIASNVVAFIRIVQALHEIASDKKRKQRLFVEAGSQNQRKTFSYKESTEFPELNGFISELMKRMEGVDDLFEKIDKSCKEFCTDTEDASKKADIIGSEARRNRLFYKAAWIGLVVLAPIPLAGFGIAYPFGIFGLFSTVGSLGSAFYFYTESTVYSREEEDCSDAKKKFMQLNGARKKLQKVTDRIQRKHGCIPIDEELKAGFTSVSQTMAQLPNSLEKLFKTLEYKETDFTTWIGEVECIMKDIDV